MAPRDLREQANLLNRLAETFKAPELNRSVPANLDDPIHVALTLIRAADEVLEFDLRLEGVELAYDRYERAVGKADKE